MTSATFAPIYQYCDTIDDNLLCTICTNPFISPVSCPSCGNVFCNVCLSTWMERHQTCPQCRADLQKGIPNRPVANMCESLRVKCESSECSWIGERSKYLDHTKKCLFTPSACSFGCGASLLLKDKEQHEIACPSKPAKQENRPPSVTQEQITELTARDRGHGNAPENVGESHYLIGENVAANDPSESLRWFQSGAEQGHAESLYKIGEYHELMKQDKREAIKYYKMAAEQNEKRALYKLGMFYLNGDGVHKNPVRGVRYLKQAADANNADALFELGQYYYYLVEENPEEAQKYFQQAADLGHAEAQYQIGLSYRYGPLSDPQKALYYFTLAAEQGHPVACYNVQQSVQQFQQQNNR